MAILRLVKINKRGKSYQIEFRNPDGERRRLSVGDNYQYAQKMAVKFTDWLIDGKDPERELELSRIIEGTKAITLSELYPTFIERHGSKQSKNMQELYKTCFINISRCKQLVNIPIMKISKALLIDYMHSRIKQDNVSPATVNREASFVKGMLSRATEWDMLDKNPLSGLRMLKEAEKREVNISEEQAETLLNSLPSHIADIVEFSIYSGFRKENTLGLKIEDIVFHDITSTGEAELIVKGGKRKRFPLGVHAVLILKRVIGEREHGFVFINPRTKTRYESIHKVFDKTVRKLGLTVNNTKLRFHDLRHVFATWLHQNGVSLDVIRVLLGHKDRSTTDRYASSENLSAINFLSALPEIKRTRDGISEFDSGKVIKTGTN